ncbi:MAG: hypothetical protein ACOYT4_03460 [Nanoarchaeota archaeon]
MEFEFFIDGKRKKLNAEACQSIWSKFRGLMFKKKSGPLLFIFNKDKEILIHSFFCSPFTAIWIGSDNKATKIQDINSWNICFSGFGKYLLEIPRENSKSKEKYRRQKRKI